MATYKPNGTLSRPQPHAGFKSFPQLPLEIRMRIWRFCAVPRVVILSPRVKGYPAPTTGMRSWNLFVQSPSIPLLQVSREARSVGERIYTKIGRPNSPALISYSYINLARDTIYIEGGFTTPPFQIAVDFLGEYLASIRYLAVSFDYCTHDPLAYPKLQELTGLQELTFVAPCSRGTKSRIVRTLEDAEVADWPDYCNFQYVFDHIVRHYSSEIVVGSPRITLAKISASQQLQLPTQQYYVDDTPRLWRSRVSQAMGRLQADRLSNV
ncbi:hypothetical protein ACEPPN_000358 [Leptodophora sp. 'Broadleaf-Isolate-01']